MSHTPGPWNYDDIRKLISNCAELGGEDEFETDDRALDANARLIAAAPDLLDACKSALNMINGDGHPPNWDLLRAAIAKAEGVQS